MSLCLVIVGSYRNPCIIDSILWADDFEKNADCISFFFKFYNQEFLFFVSIRTANLNGFCVKQYEQTFGIIKRTFYSFK